MKGSETSRKFEDVDIIAALGVVVAKNTVGFKTDFQYDTDRFVSAAESLNPEDKNLFWLSRRNGTECFSERDVFLTNTWEHNAWTHYDASQESLVAFAVKITGMEDGKVIGSLYELDHTKHVQEVKRHAEEPATVLLTFEDGAQDRVPFQKWKEGFVGIRQEYGVVEAQRIEFANEPAMQVYLKEQRQIRERYPARSFDTFIKKLSQQERPSVADKLTEAKKAVKPPSADKKPPAKTGPEL